MACRDVDRLASADPEVAALIAELKRSVAELDAARRARQQDNPNDALPRKDDTG